MSNLELSTFCHICEDNNEKLSLGLEDRRRQSQKNSRIAVERPHRQQVAVALLPRVHAVGKARQELIRPHGVANHDPLPDPALERARRRPHEEVVFGMTTMDQRVIRGPIEGGHRSPQRDSHASARKRSRYCTDQTQRHRPNRPNDSKRSSPDSTIRPQHCRSRGGGPCHLCWSTR